jgi:hypothetical protein
MISSSRVFHCELEGIGAGDNHFSDFAKMSTGKLPAFPPASPPIKPAPGTAALSLKLKNVGSLA